MKRMFAILFFVDFALFCEASERPSVYNCASSRGVTRRGVCAIESNWCCQSFSGNECSREINQRDISAAPRVEFVPKSVIIDYRPDLSTLFCVKGIRTQNNVRATEIQGLLLRLDIIQELTGNAGMSAQKLTSITETKLFPGSVSNTALENGLFCLEVDLPNNELASQSNSFRLQVTSLPADSNHFQSSYLETSSANTESSNSICDITNVDIYLTNCFNWNRTLSDEKFCVTSGSQKDKKCSNCVSQIIINFVILVLIVIALIAIVVYLLLLKAKSSRDSGQHQLVVEDKGIANNKQKNHQQNVGYSNPKIRETPHDVNKINNFPPRAASKKSTLKGTETMV